MFRGEIPGHLDLSNAKYWPVNGQRMKIASFFCFRETLLTKFYICILTHVLAQFWVFDEALSTLNLYSLPECDRLQIVDFDHGDFKYDGYPFCAMRLYLNLSGGRVIQNYFFFTLIIIPYSMQCMVPFI
jgi:hypothetical protein